VIVSHRLEDDREQLAPGEASRPRIPERKQRKVGELAARAGIVKPRENGDGVLTTEPVLVFWGNSGSSLVIFDQFGNQIGSSRRNGNEYALRDAEPRCIVRETKWLPDVAERRRRLEYEFSVAGSDGVDIGTINRDKARVRGAFELWPRIMCDGRTIAKIQDRSRKEVTRERLPASTRIARAHYLLDRFSCCRFSICDEAGHEAARITYLRPSILPFRASYVLELQPSTTEPLRTMALAATVVVDKKLVRRGGSGGGI
jgi:hypothetical protein